MAAPRLPAPTEVFLAWMQLQKGLAEGLFKALLCAQDATLAQSDAIERAHIKQFSALLYRERQTRSSITRKLSALRHSFATHLLGEANWGKWRARMEIELIKISR